MTSGRQDQGSITLELALLALPALALLSLLFGLGSLPGTRLRVDLAAHDAARAASMQRTVDGARLAADAAAQAAFTDGSVSCDGLSVRSDLRDFRPGGVVRVHVTCPAVTISAFGVELRRTVESTSTAQLDLYRGVR